MFRETQPDTQESIDDNDNDSQSSNDAEEVDADAQAKKKSKRDDDEVAPGLPSTLINDGGDDSESEAETDSPAMAYVKEHCVVPKDKLCTFAQLVGDDVKRAKVFAEEYQETCESNGAVLPISGLLLFGPSGTGKSACAQAIAHHINGTLYQFAYKDTQPNAQCSARLEALVLLALKKATRMQPAVIFADECDTLLGATAKARVGHFATVWERFTDNLLVIGATNEPRKIAPKLLTGRFEHKMFLDNPCAAARRAIIVKQLKLEEQPDNLSEDDLETIIEQTQGRSAVNIKRVVSAAVAAARPAPVSAMDFDTALMKWKSDYDEATAKANASFNKQYGHG